MIIKDRFIVWAIRILLAALALAGCKPTSQAAAPGSGGPPSSAVECLVAYSSRAGTGIDAEHTLILSADVRQESKDLGDLTFHAQYGPPTEAPGEHTFRVWVTASDTQAEIVSQLYQLPLSEAVHNQFVGDHGFSGLIYVYHPVSRAELQFTCKAR